MSEKPVTRHAIVLTKTGVNWSDEGIYFAEQEIYPEIAKDETLAIINDASTNSPDKVAEYINDDPSSFIIVSKNPITILAVDKDEPELMLDFADYLINNADQTPWESAVAFFHLDEESE